MAGLALETRNATTHRGEILGHANEVGVGLLELANRFLALGAVAADTRGFLEQDAPFLGLLLHERHDLALFDHAVGRRSQTRVVEEVLDITQTAGLVVDQVFGSPVAKGAAGNHDFRKLAGDHALVVLDDQGHFGHVHRSAFGRAREDDVFHLVATQGLGSLLAQHPTDRVDDVGLSTPVRADDARDAIAGEVHLDLVGEALEAEYAEL